MRHTRKRWAIALAVAAAVPLGAVSMPGAAQAAVPTASCYDLLSFDGLDSRYTSRHCRQATSGAGYSAGAYTNASAKDQLARQPTDAVYFFAGHAAVDVDNSRKHAAIGLVHEYPTPKQNMDVLVGDPSAAPFLQGPIRVCDETGRNCREVLLTSYPWASELTKHNLVVLQSCNTAGNNANFLGMAETVNLAGAGTAIGFTGLVYFPVNCPNCDSTGIRWSRVFWDNLRAGYTYTTATVRAANSLSNGYGYGTYKILTNPESPQRLSPAQYYVWPAGGVDPTPQSLPGSSDEPADSTLARWLGATPADWRWRTVPESGDLRVETYRPEHGLFEVDKAARKVTEAVFEKEFTGGPVTVTRDGAVRNARQFVAERRETLSEFALRSAELVDHGTFSEYRVTWQTRQNGVWLPTRVSVGVNAATGRIAYYAADPTRTTISLRHTITAEQATSAAMGLLHGDDWRLGSEPALEVTRDHTGSHHVVWIHEFVREQRDGAHIPEGSVIFTDARTGHATIHAQT